MCLFSVFSMGKPRKYKVRCRDSPKWSKLIARSITKVRHLGIRVSSCGPRSRSASAASITRMFSFNGWCAFCSVLALNFAHLTCLFRPDGSADWIPPTGFSDEMCSIAQTLFDTPAMVGRLVKGVS